jgi:quercetin 2,3-dioxygenase
LPKEHRMTAPDYQEFEASQIPIAHPSPNVEIKVISGEAMGNESEGKVVSPVKNLGGCWYFDIKITKRGESVWQEIPQGWNAFVS